MLGRPDGGGEVVLDHGPLFSAPEAGHQQNAGLDAGFAQLHAFFRAGHAEPFRAFGFERAAATDDAVTVSVGLDDGADAGGGDVIAQDAKVVAQGVERDLGPSGTGGHGFSRLYGKPLPRMNTDHADKNP